jgi:hypothetical protein
LTRSGEQTDEQELRVHGDETEGGSQGSGADVGAEKKSYLDSVTYPA